MRRSLDDLSPYANYMQHNHESIDHRKVFFLSFWWSCFHVRIQMGWIPHSRHLPHTQLKFIEVVTLEPITTIHKCIFCVILFCAPCVPYVLCIPPNGFFSAFLLIPNRLSFHASIYGFSSLNFSVFLSFLLFCCFPFYFFLFYVVSLFCALLYDASIKSYRVFVCCLSERETVGECGMD